MSSPEAAWLSVAVKSTKRRSALPGEGEASSSASVGGAGGSAFTIASEPPSGFVWGVSVTWKVCVV